MKTDKFEKDDLAQAIAANFGLFLMIMLLPPMYNHLNNSVEEKVGRILLTRVAKQSSREHEDDGID